jgi:hypothetical protein
MFGSLINGRLVFSSGTLVFAGFEVAEVRPFSTLPNYRILFRFGPDDGSVGPQTVMNILPDQSGVEIVIQNFGPHGSTAAPLYVAQLEGHKAYLELMTFRTGIGALARHMVAWTITKGEALNVS